MPLTMMPAQTAAMVEIPTHLVGRASAITNIIQRVSSSFGIAVLTTVLTTRQALHGNWLAWTVTPANPAAMSALNHAGAVMGGGAQGRGHGTHVSPGHGDEDRVRQRHRRCVHHLARSSLPWRSSPPSSSRRASRGAPAERPWRSSGRVRTSVRRARTTTAPQFLGRG